MPQRSVTTVQITYRTPSRKNLSRSSFHHERQLESVPEPTARQMIRDFSAYQATRGGAKRHEVYTYQQIGLDGAADDEVVVALDFREIAALQTFEEETPVQEKKPVSPQRN